MVEVIGFERRRAVTELADRLDAIDRRLEAIAGELREVQPVRPGALTLVSYRCGKGCAGCPHPRWLQWSQARSPDREMRRKLVGHPTTHPLHRIRRTGVFENTAYIVRRLVTEAQKLAKQRELILTHVAAARRSLRY